MSAAAVRLERQDVPPFSTDAFCAALVAALVKHDKFRLPIDHPMVDEGMEDIVRYLQDLAERELEGENEPLGLAILRLLKGLRANPNTGAFDSFWSHLRRHQPGRLSVPNPSYRYLQIRLTKAQASQEMSELPAPWSSMVDQAASLLAKRL
jgi:hypothetical protein